MQTEDYLEEQISIIIAGAVAEQILLANRSTGARNDFEKAIQLVKTMIFSGMTRLGMVGEETIPPELLHQEISRILQDIERKVMIIISENQVLIQKIADELVEAERFSGDQLRELIKKKS